MFDFEKLNKVIHEKSRLAIMSLMATRRVWGFQDLKGELKMSDGNLITHLRTLEKHGLISSTKAEGNKRGTVYAITESGRMEFESYLAILEQIVNSNKN